MLYENGVTKILGDDMGSVETIRCIARFVLVIEMVSWDGITILISHYYSMFIAGAV